MDPQPPLAKPHSDLRKLRRNTAATAAELREFLAAMRGKGPREMLGTVATSNLGRSLLQATVGVVAAIVVLTIVPFAFDRILAGDEAAESISESGEAGAGAGGAASGAGADTADTPPEPALDPDFKSKRTLDALGIGETREAPLSVNPLEDAGDDLLKDLE